MEINLDIELSRAQTALAKWQSVESFIKEVEGIEGLVESALLFRKPSINFLLDALVLAELVARRPTEQVRLASAQEQWPDGYLGQPKRFTNVEITEVMEPGRRRGDEYRKENQNKKPKPDRPENWRARAAQIPQALENAIKKKIDKNYAVKPILLIYLNIGDYGLMQEETKAAIAALKKKYADDFQEICVLWQGDLY